MFKRKSRSEEAPRYEETSPGIKVYPPGERIFHESEPAKPRTPVPGRGPLDPDPTVMRYSGRYKKQMTYRVLCR